MEAMARTTGVCEFAGYAWAAGFLLALVAGQAYGATLMFPSQRCNGNTYGGARVFTITNKACRPYMPSARG